MKSKDVPEADDPIETFVMSWGLPGFVIGLAAVNVALFYICRRAIEFFFPGA